MLCCGTGRRKRVELDEEKEPVLPRNNVSIQSLHDYIFSPKDFCDSVLQKKLVPEFYLNGIEPSSLRSSQDSMTGGGGGRNSPNNSTQNLRSSQNNLRASQSQENLGDSKGRNSSNNSLHNSLNNSLNNSQNNLRVSQSQENMGQQQQGNHLRVSVSDIQLHDDVDYNNSNNNGTTNSAPVTPTRASARYSNFFSSTSYANINYYEEFCALFPHFAIVPMDGYRVELGGRVSAGQDLFIQEQDAYNLAYQKIFQKNDHHNFVGGAPDNPFIISILVCDDVEGGCRTIVRTKFRDHHLIVPHQNPPIKMARYALTQVRKTDTGLPVDKDKKLIINQVKGSFLVRDLSNFEDKSYKSKHKMGILYCKGGQTTEEEMFSNLEPSEEFNCFLDTIASRVPLRGFPFNKFNGGLDTKTDLTGTETYYTEYEGLELMFHVSTLLPFTPDRPVQIERKKHIGNDVVCIVFMDSPTPFRPNTIASKFIHVLIVVQFLERNSNNVPIYRVSVASKPGVESHLPVLPTPPHFEGGEEFRRFLLTKAINAERAAGHAPAFKLARTRMNALSTIIEKHVEEIPPKKCFG